jgi:hypothetical protein
VVAGPEIIRSGFATSGAAWRWINKHERRALYVRRPNAETSGSGVYFGSALSAIDPYGYAGGHGQAEAPSSADWSSEPLYNRSGVRDRDADVGGREPSSDL